MAVIVAKNKIAASTLRPRALFCLRCIHRTWIADVTQ